MSGPSAQKFSYQNALTDMNFMLEEFDETIPNVCGEELLSLEEGIAWLENQDQGDVDGLAGTNSSSDDETLGASQKEGERKRQAYRRRKKSERENLHVMAAKLTKELQQIQNAKQNELALFDATRSPEFFQWKAVAAKQYEKRVLSETEQEKLIAAVTIQGTYIETLTNMVRKQMGGAEHAEGSISLKRQRVQEKDKVFFDACIRELDANYLRTEEVFSTCGSTLQMESQSDHSTTTKSFQRYIKEVMPFPLSQAGDLLWKVGNQHHSDKPDFKRYDGFADPENTSARTFREEITLKTGSRMQLRHRLVTRRYTTSDCIVFTWKLVSAGEGAFNGLHFDETAWGRLKVSTGSCTTGTEIETCLRRTPIHFGGSFERNHVDEALKIRNDEARDEIVSLMEKLLVGEAKYR